jgi:chorismate mutase
MPLSNEHIPLPCSLRDPVKRRFPQSGSERDEPRLETRQVLNLLRQLDTEGASALISLRRQAERQQLPGGLDPWHAALIEWINLAFERWQTDYPLEERLARELRKLQPLAMAVALQDEAFLTAGAHPLHQLLDCLQQSAVGWQQRLDRAGQMLEQRVLRAVVRAREWFDNPALDFGQITRELAAAAERDAARAQRMIQRLAEAESASLKTEQVKREVAAMINAGLERYPLPAAIGEFLKGPWFESAQLVALKFGTDSHEWRQVERVTGHLLESVQPREGLDDAELERLNGVTRRVPQELREWLISLQHDAEAADDAIGLVEYAHLRLRHGQSLGGMQIPTIATGAARESANTDNDARELHNGHWFLMNDNDGELRAQLTLQLESGQHLLFTNVVGLKALDLQRADFLRLLDENRARPLPTEDSFSLSLAAAAGIDSDEALRALIDPGHIPETQTTDTADDDSATSDATSVDSEPPADSPPVEAENWDEELPALTRDAPYATPDPEPEPAPAPIRPAAAADTELESLELTLVEETPPATPAAPRSPAPAEAPRATARRRPVSEPQMDVPMGAWLGFHDGETPIMAKLAVYDPRRDNYIFVNRRGIALRELSRQELLDLIDDGLVDILETRSYFRDEVQRARSQHND